MTNKPSVALIGAGAMGGALYRGWLKAGSIDCARSAVFDPAPSDDIAVLSKAHGVSVNPQGASGFDILVVAVKPQIAGKVLGGYAAFAQKAVVVSVMAGASVATLAGHLTTDDGEAPAKIVRTMPNLPAAIGAGVSGLYASDAVTVGERSSVEALMAAVGSSIWVETEKDIDLVTAVSGSGPAYFFLMAEALAEAGVAAGLSETAAKDLAEATLAGAGKLMAVDQRSAGEIREAVTSPGGTTAAALGVLDGEEQAVRGLMKEAVKAAAKRAGELAG